MFLDKPGDRDSRVLREAQTLRDAGHAVTLVARQRPGEESADVVPDRLGSLDVLRVPLPQRRPSVRSWIRLPHRFWSRAAYRVRTRHFPRAAALALAGLAVLPVAIVLRSVAAYGRLRPSSPNHDLVDWLVRWRFVVIGWNDVAARAAPPADVFHGHDLTALPAAALAARLHGARFVYDSHEVFMESGRNATRPSWARRLFMRYERRLASDAAAVVTVNDALAEVLARRLRPARIVVVHNTPPRTESAPPVDLLRAATGIAADTPIALSHGGFSRHRGLEELVLALLEPGMERVHAVLMGYGGLEAELRDLAAEPRFGGRAHVLPAVPPSELLAWVASAEVGVMAIHPTTLNHRLATPNKLFECLAAGVPVVAGDLPGMRTIILADPAAPLGELCDPTDPASIAAAIRRILDPPPAERAELRARCLRAAHDRWNWETESARLVELYEDLASTAAPTG